MSARSTFKYPYPEDLNINFDRVMALIGDYYMLNRSAVSTDTDKIVKCLQHELKTIWHILI